MTLEQMARLVGELNARVTQLEKESATQAVGSGGPTRSLLQGFASSKELPDSVAGVEVDLVTSIEMISYNGAITLVSHRKKLKVIDNRDEDGQFPDADIQQTDGVHPGDGTIETADCPPPAAE